MRRLTLTINDGAAHDLVRVAQAERRRPQDQAASLLERSITELVKRTQSGKEVADHAVSAQ